MVKVVKFTYTSPCRVGFHPYPSPSPPPPSLPPRRPRPPLTGMGVPALGSHGARTWRDLPGSAAACTATTAKIGAPTRQLNTAAERPVRPLFYRRRCLITPPRRGPSPPPRRPPHREGARLALERWRQLSGLHTTQDGVSVRPTAWLRNFGVSVRLRNFRDVEQCILRLRAEMDPSTAPGFILLRGVPS